jgi:peptidoglycan/xylan/chitin deacetylase (PgdA/CDA1 family)
VRVALTFDAEHPDRPRSSPHGVAAILDALAAVEARATFFLQGRWARAFPGVARRIADHGHLVGSHSYFHARMPLLSDAGLDFDLREADRWIRANTGASPRPWFRFPWGAGDPRVRAALERHRFVPVGWDVVAEDWEESRTASVVEEDLVAGIRAVGDGVIVLLHAWPGATAEALPRVLARLREDEARFVTVAELTDRDLERTPDPPVAAANPR